MPRIPIRPISTATCCRHSGPSPGPTGRSSTTGCSRRSCEPGKRYPVYLLRLRRAARPAGHQRLVRPAAASRGPGRQGLDRVHHRQSRHQPPRHEVRKRGLSLDGRCRSAGPAGGRRVAQAPAVRRPSQDRGAGLVLRRLHDAEAAREGAGRVRRRCRGRAGDEVGTVRHRLHRAVSRQSGDRSQALSDL